MVGPVTVILALSEFSFLWKGITSRPNRAHSGGHFFCPQILSHRVVSAFTVHLPQLFRGILSAPGDLLVFILCRSTAASTFYFSCRSNFTFSWGMVGLSYGGVW